MVLSAAQREKTKNKVDSFKGDACKYTVLFLGQQSISQVFIGENKLRNMASSHLTKNAINSKKVLDRSRSNRIIYFINFDYNLKDCLTRISNKYANF